MQQKINLPNELTLPFIREVYSDIHFQDGVEACQLDFNLVEEIDSSGMQLMLLVMKKARSKNIELEFINVSQGIEHFLKQFQLSPEFEPLE
ncbi:STAS domain-containing protein [Algicola sagamiensis]|uniref:STAS domain-containing protein n=1 Tax=Algicola sagamiensis TaxID=163869 RepID=UPI000380D995|nr:STAS domain-containing protein [Algicola sagamiensis]